MSTRTCSVTWRSASRAASPRPSSSGAANAANPVGGRSVDGAAPDRRRGPCVRGPVLAEDPCRRVLPVDAHARIPPSSSRGGPDRIGRQRDGAGHDDVLREPSAHGAQLLRPDVEGPAPRRRPHSVRSQPDAPHAVPERPGGDVADPRSSLGAVLRRRAGSSRYRTNRHRATACRHRRARGRLTPHRARTEGAPIPGGRRSARGGGPSRRQRGCGSRCSMHMERSSRRASADYSTTRVVR